MPDCIKLSEMGIPWLGWWIFVAWKTLVPCIGGLEILVKTGAAVSEFDWVEMVCLCMLSACTWLGCIIMLGCTGLGGGGFIISPREVENEKLPFQS